MPTNNSDCGHECFFPQRIADHPFLLDRFGYSKEAASTRLRPETQELLRQHDWFWVVTGVHKGGGLDCSLIIRKAGPAIGSARHAAPPAALPVTDGAALLQAQESLRLAEASHRALKVRHQELQSSLLSMERAVQRQCRPAAGDVTPGTGSAGAGSMLWVLLASSVALNCLQVVMARGGRGRRT